MIKIRATITNSQELDKLIEVLEDNFTLLQISRKYENKTGNEKSLYKRVYIDLEQKD